MKKETLPDIDIVVEHANVFEISADVLALKYANVLYRVDRAAVNALKTVGINVIGHLPKPSGFYITPTNQAIVNNKGVTLTGCCSKPYLTFGTLSWPAKGH